MSKVNLWRSCYWSILDHCPFHFNKVDSTHHLQGHRLYVAFNAGRALDLTIFYNFYIYSGVIVSTQKQKRMYG